VLRLIDSWDLRLRPTERPSWEGSQRGIDRYSEQFEGLGPRSVAPIEVFNLNDNLYIINGHHRQRAARGVNSQLRYVEISEAALFDYGYRSVDEVVWAALDLSR